MSTSPIRYAYYRTLWGYGTIASVWEDYHRDAFVAEGIDTLHADTIVRVDGTTRILAPMVGHERDYPVTCAADLIP